MCNLGDQLNGEELEIHGDDCKHGMWTSVCRQLLRDTTTTGGSGGWRVRTRMVTSDWTGLGSVRGIL